MSQRACVNVLTGCWRCCSLRQAGAVLIAKLATGEMAYDDVWWGGKVKNPWNIVEGSSGSSAGMCVILLCS